MPLLESRQQEHDRKLGENGGDGVIYCTCPARGELGMLQFMVGALTHRRPGRPRGLLDELNK